LVQSLKEFPEMKRSMISTVDGVSRRIGLGVAAMLTALAGLLAGCDQPAVGAPEKNLVRVVTVDSLNHLQPAGEAAYLALVRAEKETDLAFKVGGIIDRLGPDADTDWDEGTPVKAGAVLAELKQGDFTNALNSARAHADLSVTEVERCRKLRVTDAVSQQEMDVAEANARTARAQWDEAEQNLRDSRLVASLDGVVLQRYVNAHATVGAGQRVLRFADTSVMSVELGLPDRLITRLKPGDTVDVVVSALEGRPPFRGRVSEVGVAANPADRLFRIVIKVPNPDGQLRSGMTARINLGEAATVVTNAVSIPLSALVTAAVDGTRSGTNSAPLAVFVVKDGKASERLVKTGDILDSSIVVTEGLQAGDQVVTSGASFLHDGAPVEVVADQPAARP
jgi:multidrug efflux system membrane fusion protein